MSAIASKLSILARLAVIELREFFQVPDSDQQFHSFDATQVAQLQRIMRAPAGAPLDDQTWNDLLLDSYQAQLFDEVSIFGQQVLHRRLRDGLDDADCAALGKRLAVLSADPALLEQLCDACKSLGRAEVEIAALLFEDPPPVRPKWVGYTWLLPLGLAASLVGAAFSALAWVPAALALYQMVAIQMRFHQRADEWGWSRNAVQMLLRVCSLVGKCAHPLVQQFGPDAARAGKINRSLTRSPMMELTPFVRAYADWFFLANIKHYFKEQEVVFGERALLRECYLRCANLEADLALARHLLATPLHCRVERCKNPNITIEKAVHPLLAQPAPLDVLLAGKGAFISGQNGSGKSTLLRTLGLNLVVARAFGFCYAQSAALPAAPVYASMQGEDSLLGGESLYIAELRRAQELLAEAGRGRATVFIIDEIFRGTNHLESVSAAAAVLDELATKGLVIVSSHNLVLAALLEHRLAPFCVSAANGQLTLAPGVLAHTNGIALLAARGFGPQIEANAARVFEWLSGYLAQPADCSHLWDEVEPVKKLGT